MDSSQVIKFEIDDEIFLRAFVESDAEIVLETVIRNYDHLRSFMEWIRTDYCLQDAREFVDRSIAEHGERKSRNFGIFRGQNFVGTIGFAYFDHDARVTEIGYWIDAAEQGKGIILKACKLLVDHAFREMGMNRIQIRCAAANARSAAIPERLGFTKEGIQRQHILRDGKLHDFAIYGLLASEWMAIEKHKP